MCRRRTAVSTCMLSKMATVCRTVNKYNKLGWVQIAAAQVHARGGAEVPSGTLTWAWLGAAPHAITKPHEHRPSPFCRRTHSESDLRMQSMKWTVHCAAWILEARGGARNRRFKVHTSLETSELDWYAHYRFSYIFYVDHVYKMKNLRPRDKGWKLAGMVKGEGGRRGQTAVHRVRNWEIGSGEYVWWCWWWYWVCNDTDGDNADDAADADDADSGDMARMSPGGIDPRQNCLWKRGRGDS